MLETNPTLLIENPEPRRREVEAFGSWDELEAVATELGTSLPIIVAGTGLRPEEWLALERRDIDRPRGIVHVRRVYVDQHLREYGKTDGSLRAVPLCARVAEALEALPPQLRSPLLFPGPRGAYLDYKVGGAGTGHRPSGQRAFRTGPRTRSGIPSPRSRSRLESAPLRSAG